ncbi:MAG: WD40 repeat domain-containing protein [Oscillatoriophycideae cyanobacterium NC_groundwater_1537_Pr4_S-0.65um_50_18]|nr:WD40 repeat domain-containing protein [Oscillatoriophycideae cyanobacterium NC_groundwater_1537_Pr4_S-0.65um_50_18]
MSLSRITPVAASVSAYAFATVYTSLHLWAVFCVSASAHSRLTSPHQPGFDQTHLSLTSAQATPAESPPLQQVADPSWQPGTVTLITITKDQGGHSAPVRSVAFSPNGQFFASGSADKTIKVWNLKAEALERSLTQSSDQINAIAFSPDGRFLAAGCLDGSVRLWNWQTGELLKTFSEHENLVTSVAFSPDSRILASGSGDKTIHLWNVPDGTLHQQIVTEQFIQAIAFQPNGNILASTGLGMTVDLWDWTTGDLRRSLGRYASAIYAIAFSPDGQAIAFSPDAAANAPITRNGADRNTVRLWNLQGRQIDQPLQGHTDYVNAVAFSPSGQTLISGSLDRTVKIWNVQTGELVRNFLENEKRVLSAAFSPDGRTFALGSADGTIKVFISSE